jgi:hypothetical protein
VIRKRARDKFFFLRDWARHGRAALACCTPSQEWYHSGLHVANDANSFAAQLSCRSFSDAQVKDLNEDKPKRLADKISEESVPSLVKFFNRRTNFRTKVRVLRFLAMSRSRLPPYVLILHNEVFYLINIL